MPKQTYQEMQQSIGTDKFTEAMESNMNVIKRHMKNGYTEDFAVYDGGDTARMIQELTDLGFNVRPNPSGTSMPYVRLPAPGSEVVHNPDTGSSQSSPRRGPR